MANRDGGLSPDYTNPEPRSERKGLTADEMPAKGSSKAKWIVGAFVVVVLGLLVTRMPFLAGSLNPGAPLDELSTASMVVEPDGDVVAVQPAADASSSMPTPNAITPSEPLVAR